MLANAVILETPDVVLGRSAGAARQVDDRVVALAGLEARVILVILIFFLIIPGRGQFDEMQFDESGIRVLTILRYLQESTLDFARLVLDALFERTHERIDAEAVASVEVRRTVAYFVGYSLRVHTGRKE